MDAEKKKRLLLVEDDAIIALSTTQQLKRKGYETLHAGSGEKAVEYTVSGDQNIDLILMDIDLGSGIDGTEAAQLILKKKDIPVVFLSSHTESEIVEKTEKITSYGYVVKNTGITILDTSIKMAFKLFSAHKEISRKNMVIKAGNENLRVSIEHLEEANKALLLAQEKLKISDRRFKKAQEIGLIGNWEYNIEDNTIWGSEEAHRIYGLPLDDEHLSLEDVEAMDYDKAKMYKALMDLIRDEKPYDIEFQIKPLNSRKWIWLHSVAELRRDNTGKPVNVEGVIQDISAQKRAEFSLVKLGKAMNNASDIILMTDLEGIITFINPMFTETYGYSKEEVVGKKTPGILNKNYNFIGSGKDFWKVLDQSKRLNFDFENVTKSGDNIFVESKIDPLYDINGRLDGFLEIQRDITEWRKERPEI